LDSNFLFAIALRIANLDLACRSVNQGIHRSGEGWAFLDEMIAQEAECAALRELSRVFIGRTILEAKGQMGGYAIPLCLLSQLTIGEGLAFKCSQNKEAMHQAFRVTHRYRICW